MSDAEQLLAELNEIFARFAHGGERLVSDILDDYEAARAKVEEVSDHMKDLQEDLQEQKKQNYARYSALHDRDLLGHEPLQSLEAMNMWTEFARKFAHRNEAQLPEVEETSNCDEEVVDAGEGLLGVLVSDMNRNLPSIVKAVYEGTRSGIEEAGTAEKKLEELLEGQTLLQRLMAFPEHAEYPLLQKALLAFDDYESTLQRALANEAAEREEEEFRNAVAGITYTATDKQVRYLISLGAKPRDLDGITKQQAGAMISRMKKG